MQIEPSATLAGIVSVDIFSRRFMLPPSEKAIRMVSPWHFSEVFWFAFVVFWILGLINLILMFVLNFGPPDITGLPILYKLWGILVSSLLLTGFWLFVPTFFRTLALEVSPEAVSMQITSPVFRTVSGQVKISDYLRLVLRREKIEHRQVYLLSMLRIVLPFIPAPAFTQVILDLEHKNPNLTLTLAAYDNPTRSELEELQACGRGWAEILNLPFVHVEEVLEVGLPSHVARRGSYADAFSRSDSPDVGE